MCSGQVIMDPVNSQKPRAKEIFSPVCIFSQEFYQIDDLKHDQQQLTSNTSVGPGVGARAPVIPGQAPPTPDSVGHGKL